MKFYQELFVTSDQITKDQWQKLYTILLKQLGMFSKFQIIIKIQDNVIRFIIGADKDISQISNNIDMGILRNIPESETSLPLNYGKERFFQFTAGGNLLDLKERIAVKNSKHLEAMVINIRAIDAKKSVNTVRLYFKDTSGHYSAAKKILTFFPAHLLEIDFATNTNYMKKSSPKYLSLEKTLNLFDSSDVGSIFSISTFPYFSSPRYLGLNSFEFDKHSFIIGATGSGKSKFIELYIDRLSTAQKQLNYRVIVIDPHDNLRHDLSAIPNSKVVNFANETTQLFGGEEVQTDISAATELTTSLMKSLLDDQFNARLERVLRFSLYVLFVAQTMSLDYLKRFLTEVDLRNQILKHTHDHVPSNIRQFFLTDFNDIKTTHYNEAILPIVSLVDEMQLQPALVNESDQSLAKIIQQNFLTIFSLNKVTMGEKVVKTVSGLLISQIFLLAQARAFNERIILIVDEVSVVQTPVLASILSEARKFNLSVILTQQYFGQIEKDLRDAIFANAYNYYVFRVSEEDAESLSGNLSMEIPKEILESELKKGIKEEQLKIRYLTELHPRECIIRISANGQVLPCFKAKTVDVKSSMHNASDSSKPQESFTPKLKKFSEEASVSYPELTSTTNTMGGEQKKTLPSNTQITQKNTDTNPEYGESPEENTNIKQSTNFEIDPSLRKTKRNDPESGPEFNIFDSEQSIDPELDPDLRESKKSKDAIKNLSKTAVSNQALSTHIRPGMNLAELLASQSSDRKVKDKGARNG